MRFTVPPDASESFKSCERAISCDDGGPSRSATASNSSQLAVDAVRCKPFSAANSSLTGKNTGNNRNPGDLIFHFHQNVFKCHMVLRERPLRLLRVYRSSRQRTDTFKSSVHYSSRVSSCAASCKRGRNFLVMSRIATRCACAPTLSAAVTLPPEF
jgi:hypothetical protein